MTAPVIIFSSVIGFLGIGDTSDAQLAVLVSQSASQLNELQKILKTADVSVRQLNQAIELSQKVQEGVDKVLKPLQETRQFQRALLRLKESGNLREFRYGAEEVRDYVDHYKGFFPKQAEREEEQRRDYEAFDSTTTKANAADLKELEQLESTVLKESAAGKFSPARATQISTQIQLKQWESQILMRQQLQRLIDENNTLKEEVSRQRRKEQIARIQSQKALESSFQSGWEGLTHGQ